MVNIDTMGFRLQVGIPLPKCMYISIILVFVPTNMSGSPESEHTAEIIGGTIVDLAGGRRLNGAANYLIIRLPY